MADPLEGLPSQVTGNAIRKLKDLKNRWGVEEPNSWTEPPRLIMVRAMDDVEIWRLRPTHPSVEAKKVMECEYELIELRRGGAK